MIEELLSPVAKREESVFVMEHEALLPLAVTLTLLLRPEIVAPLELLIVASSPDLRARSKRLIPVVPWI